LLWRDQAILEAYDSALTRLKLETGYPRDVFPSSPPFTFEQLVDDDSWPELD
jgi:hypothetical protein